MSFEGHASGTKPPQVGVDKSSLWDDEQEQRPPHQRTTPGPVPGRFERTEYVTPGTGPKRVLPGRLEYK